MTNKNRLSLRIGGVMRCCIHTLDEVENVEGFVQDEGTVVPCKYCKSALWVRDGAWEWHRDYKPETA